MMAEAAPPPTRSPAWREILIGLAVFGIYVGVAAAAGPGRAKTADRNAETLLRLERWLHIDIERGLNHWLAPHRTLTVLADFVYAYAYVISAVVLLMWLYVRFPAHYRRVRNSFLLLNLLVIGCFAVFPATPARMLPELGEMETLARGTTVGSWVVPLVSSAETRTVMPSVQLAWVLWVTVVLARLGRGAAVQLMSAAYVAATFFAIVSTGNHFVLDAVAAIVFVWASVEVVDPGRRKAALISSADAFFLYVETPAAPQHVGGMAVLARSGNGTPTLGEVRALVRAELPAMPRFRQRPACPSPWRRWRWVDVDPDEMDWDWHVSERTALVPSALDDIDGAAAALSRAVADVAAEPMPRDRPMWRIVLVREITPGRSGLLFVVHHCVGDGVGTVVHALHILAPRVELAAGSVKAAGRLHAAAATAVGLAQLATDGRPAAKLGPGSPARQFATAAFDLAAVRSVAHRRGARVTDVVLYLLGTALARTHQPFCASLRYRLRVAVPIMLRQPGTSAEGNVTAAAMIDLPLHDIDAGTWLARISQNSARLLTAKRAVASRFVMATVLGALPVAFQRLFARTVYGPAFVQAIVSNMAGPSAAMSLAGVPLERVAPILPLAPDAPIALGALSWTGALGIGLAVDPAFLDADTVAAAMNDALRELAAADAQPDRRIVDRTAM
jgi:diacylglycerol O-acyltransferase / wax synthase